MIAPDLSERLAAELVRTGGQIEALALQLCLDPVVFERHAGPLQRFDQLVQIIGEIARVLQCPGTLQEALATLRLDTMRERMIDAGM